MRPQLLAQTLASFIAVKRPMLIEGSPGLGKTQLPRQVADELGIEFRLLHAPLMQPEDYGMPVVNANRDGIKFVVPDKFPLEGSDCPSEGLLCLDELPQTDNAGQKILANLIQEREIHGYKIKPGWALIATGNRMQDRAGANRVLSHLRARVTTITFEPHLDDWCQWALTHNVDPSIISFIRFKPNMLNNFNADKEVSPTPRSWAEGISPIIGNVPPEVENECFTGAIGEGAAAEFTGFLKIVRKLPNPDVVLMNPDKADVPKEPSVLYAISGAIAHRATQDNFERVMTYAKRLPPEFMVLVVRDAVRKDKTIQHTRTFTDWATKEGARVLM